MEEHRFNTPTYFARIALVLDTYHGRIVEHVRGYGVEHVLDLLLEQVAVDHGAVGGLFNGEVAPVAGEVEYLG